jgi:uncharacterized protein YqjF (DUF2071 family)
MAFFETNLRTYVRAPDGEPGIYFFSLDASSVSAVVGARLLFGLPYFPAVMAATMDGRRIDYRSRRRVGGHARLEVAWTVGDAGRPAAPASRDHFLVERYSLYVMRGGTIHRGRVRHHPYSLHDASVDHLEESLLAAAGVVAPAAPPLVRYSPGVDVTIYWLERVPRQVDKSSGIRTVAARSYGHLARGHGTRVL